MESANTELVERHKRLMEAFQRFPGRLETDENIERGKRFAKQLKDSVSTCRSSRLADTKPLRDLLKRVDTFFKTMEEQANKAHASVVASLAEEGRRRAATSMQSAPASNTDSTVNSVLIDRNTGEILGTAVQTNRTEATIPLIWQIQEVSRDALDLEAIRPFLTDAALFTAARAHLKAHGPHSLAGVKYIQTAVLD